MNLPKVSGKKPLIFRRACQPTRRRPHRDCDLCNGIIQTTCAKTIVKMQKSTEIFKK